MKVPFDEKSMRDFDPESESVERIRSWLYAIIEAEACKSDDEADLALISECSALDAALAGEDLDAPLTDAARAAAAAIAAKAAAATARTSGESSAATARTSGESSAAGAGAAAKMSGEIAESVKKSGEASGRAPAAAETVETSETATETVRGGIEPAAEMPAAAHADKQKKRYTLRALSAAAAALVLVCALLTATAALPGYSAGDYVLDHIKEILNIKPGEAAGGAGVSLIWGESVEEYDSLDAAVRALGVDILYPAALPEGVRIERILRTDRAAGEYNMTFVADDGDVCRINVGNYVFSDPEKMQNASVYEVNGIRYYVTDLHGEYRAAGLFEGCEYLVTCTDWDDLMLILNGLKKIQG